MAVLKTARHNISGRCPELYSGRPFGAGRRLCASLCNSAFRLETSPAGAGHYGIVRRRNSNEFLCTLLLPGAWGQSPKPPEKFSQTVLRGFLSEGVQAYPHSLNTAAANPAEYGSLVPPSISQKEHGRNIFQPRVHRSQAAESQQKTLEHRIGTHAQGA